LSTPFVNAAYIRIPAETVRQSMPDGEGRRLRLLAYWLPCDTLPNALPRPDRILGEGALRLGCDYLLLARVVQDAGGARSLEVAAKAYDAQCEAAVSLDMELPLLRAAYSLLGQAHIAARAHRFAQSRGGRN